MNIKTVHEAAQLLGVREAFLRRMIREGRIRTMMLGNRTMLDIDDAREAIAAHTGACIHDVAEETGLTESAIRRGCREGWIPYRIDGKTYIFDLEQVKTSIKNRMK